MVPERRSDFSACLGRRGRWDPGQALGSWSRAEQPRCPPGRTRSQPPPRPQPRQKPPPTGRQSGIIGSGPGQAHEWAGCLTCAWTCW